MLDKFVSKFSMYDILAMVIPGATILLFFSMLFSRIWKLNLVFNNNEVTSYFIIIVFSYILGFINQELAVIMWKIFRNNPLLLYVTLNETTKHNEKSPLRSRTYIMYRPTHRLSEIKIYCVLTFFVLLVMYACISDILFSHFDTESGVYLILCTVIYIILCGIIMYIKYKTFKIAKLMPGLVSDYYDAYYFVAQHTYCNDVFIMEGQVAFLKNMIIPISLFVAWPDSIWLSFSIIDILGVFWIKFFLILVCILMCICVYLRIKKIHGLVWENYEYLKVNEKHSEDTSIVICVQIEKKK